MSNVLCFATVLDALVVCSSPQIAFVSLSGLGVSGSCWRAQLEPPPELQLCPHLCQSEEGITSHEKVTWSAEIVTTSPV